MSVPGTGQETDEHFHKGERHTQRTVFVTCYICNRGAFFPALYCMLQCCIKLRWPDSKQIVRYYCKSSVKNIWQEIWWTGISS